MLVNIKGKVITVTQGSSRDLPLRDLIDIARTARNNGLVRDLGGKSQCRQPGHFHQVDQAGVGDPGADEVE